MVENNTKGGKDSGTVRFEDIEEGHYYRHGNSNMEGVLIVLKGDDMLVMRELYPEDTTRSICTKEEWNRYDYVELEGEDEIVYKRMTMTVESLVELMKKHRNDPNHTKNGVETVSYDDLEEGGWYNDPENDREPPMEILMKGNGIIVYSGLEEDMPLTWKKGGWEPNRYIPIDGPSSAKL